MDSILLVDDDPQSRGAAARLLRAEGYRVTEAANGEEALAALKQQRPADLILLDLDMPRIDGLTFLGLLRADPRFNAIPVVVTSGFADPDFRRRVERLWADDYLVKCTFSGAELIQTVRKHLRHAAMEAANYGSRAVAWS